jgi:hypothetical protein
MLAQHYPIAFIVRKNGSQPKVPNRFWFAPEYLAALREEIKSTHGCDTAHVYSAQVDEEMHGEGVWKGVVEVFALTHHPDTNRCYAWGTPRPGGGWEITTVLAVDPVLSPQAAVRWATAQRYANSRSA